MFRSSIQDLVEWMYDTTEDDDMTELVSTYLMSQGKATFGDTANSIRRTVAESENTKQLVQETDNLGWDCLLEGRVSTKWVNYAKSRLSASGNPMSPEGWMRRFIDKLMKVTLQQWIYQNHKVHYRGKGGLTLKEHDAIFDRLGEILYTDTDSLLPQDERLLLMDRKKISEGTLPEERTWIVQMEASKQARGDLDTVGDTREPRGQ